MRKADPEMKNKTKVDNNRKVHIDHTQASDYIKNSLIIPKLSSDENIKFGFDSKAEDYKKTQLDIVNNNKNTIKTNRDGDIRVCSLPEPYWPEQNKAIYNEPEIIFNFPENFSGIKKSNIISTSSRRIISAKMNLYREESKKERDLTKMRKLDSIISKNYSDPKFTLSSTLHLIGISQRGLQRKVQKFKNTTPSDYLRNFRLEKARYLLQKGFRISKVAAEVGFSSQAYFSNCFKNKYRKTPKAYQSEFLEP